jgi:hypothetical protein
MRGMDDINNDYYNVCMYMMLLMIYQLILKHNDDER